MVKATYAILVIAVAISGTACSPFNFFDPFNLQNAFNIPSAFNFQRAFNILNPWSQPQIRIPNQGDLDEIIRKAVGNSQLIDDFVENTQTIIPRGGNYSGKKFTSTSEGPVMYIRGNSSIVTLKDGLDGEKVEIYPLPGKEPNSPPIYDLVSNTQKRSYVIEILGGLPDNGVLKVSTV